MTHKPPKAKTAMRHNLVVRGRFSEARAGKGMKKTSMSAVMFITECVVARAKKDVQDPLTALSQ